MGKVVKNNTGLELVTSWSSGYETFKKMTLLVKYIGTSLMLYKAVFELFQKLHPQIYRSQFMTS